MTSPLFNTSGYFASPTVSLGVQLLPAAAQAHYSLPLPVQLHDVTVEDGSRDDLDPLATLMLTGSRSLGDENFLHSRQHVASQPIRRFKAPRRQRGIVITHSIYVSL